MRSIIWIAVCTVSMIQAVAQVDYDKKLKELKVELLKIPTLDVLLGGDKSPLMVAMQRTAVSLAKCYAGEQRKLLLPEIP